MYTIVKAIGAYLPKKFITNDELSQSVATNDEWIRTRTGIGKRYIAQDFETTSFMAAQAANEALRIANISPNDIDHIIVATTTPEKIFPSTACLVQKHLQANNAACFDIQAVCAGFVYGMSVADSLIKAKQAKNILLIGSECMSSILNWQDRSTCILFGDGAGAFLLSASIIDPDEQNDVKCGILGSKLFSNGNLADLLYADASSNNNIVMDGAEVYKHAVIKMTDAIEQVLKICEVDKAKINAIIPHQANLRIIDAVSKKLSLAQDIVIANSVIEHANTSAASIPLAAYDLYISKQIKKGDLIATTAIGGGMCWGANLFYL